MNHKTKNKNQVEPFWVWVEDNDNERIYHTEYLLIHKKQKNEVTTKPPTGS